MNIKELDINSIKPYKNNAKKHDKTQTKAKECKRSDIKNDLL